MPDRWRWEAWGEDLRAARDRRLVVERVLRGLLLVAGLAGVAAVVVDRDVPTAAAVALAAWLVLVAWFVARTLASAITATRRRAVLGEVREAVGPQAGTLSADELERLVTAGSTGSRGMLVEATVDGDHVVVSRRQIPDEWVSGGSGDPSVPYGGG